MVRPPPGVSSAASVPPIASMKPRATARPRPTPAPAAVSPSRWNGWNICSRLLVRVRRGRGRRCVVRRCRRVVCRVTTRRSRRGCQRRRWRPRWRAPVRADRGRPDERATLGRCRGRPGRRSPEIESRAAGDDVVECHDGGLTGWTAPASRRLASSRLPMTRSSRSALLVDGGEELVLGLRRASRCRPGSRLDTDALIEPGGCAGRGRRRAGWRCAAGRRPASASARAASSRGGSAARAQRPVGRRRRRGSGRPRPCNSPLG